MGQCSSNSTVINTEINREQSRPSHNFNPFYQKNAEETDEHHILAQYKFHSHYTDKYLGKCDILEEKATGDLYLGKKMFISDEEEYERQLAELMNRKNTLTYENVIQIRGTIDNIAEVISKNSDGFFKEHKNIILIIDYPFLSLHRELSNRVLKNMPFTKDQLMNIAFSAVKGYANIERAGYVNDKVRLKNIFIGIKSKQSILKVAETNLLQMNPNYLTAHEKGVDTKENTDVYLAPEQLNALVQGQESFYHPKSAVFSLGMSLLQLCLMVPSSEVYHYERYTVDEAETRGRVGIAGKKYGGFVERLLRDMLQFSPDNRPSFNDLQEKMPKLIQMEDDRSVINY